MSIKAYIDAQTYDNNLTSEILLDEIGAHYNYIFVAKAAIMVVSTRRNPIWLLFFSIISGVWNIYAKLLSNYASHKTIWWSTSDQNLYDIPFYDNKNNHYYNHYNENYKSHYNNRFNNCYNDCESCHNSNYPDVSICVVHTFLIITYLQRISTFWSFKLIFHKNAWEE